VDVSKPVIVVTREKGQRELVDVTVEVLEGEQYRLKEIAFSSTAAFSPAELRKIFPISDGDIFDREKIGFGLEDLRGLYCTKGYVNFSAVPETAIDDNELKVSLKIDLDDGGAFQVGNLIARGVESQPGAREKLLKAWRSYEGKVYDCGVLDRFLRDLHARAAVKPQDIFEVSPDSQKHVVNVCVTLMK
jgi:outer membrane protein insertion porin family